MEGLIYFICWLSGIVLGTQMVAASLSPLDLHYRLYYSRYAIAGRIMGWFGGSLIFYLLLPDSYEMAFVDGVQLVVFVFVILRIGPKLVCMNSGRKQNQRYENYLKEIR